MTTSRPAARRVSRIPRPAANRGRRPGRWGLGAFAVAVLVLGAGGAALASGGSGRPAYRLATAGPASVTQTVVLGGTVTAASTVDAGFAVAGTISAVHVAVGQRVRAGQPLAALDSAALATALDKAKASLALAQDRLAADVAAQAAANAAASALAAARQQLADDQRRVLTDQRAADAALRTAQQALAAATGACRPLASNRPTPAASTRPTRAASTRPTRAASARPAGGCAEAEAAALTTEGRAGAAQRAVATAQSALSGALAGAEHPSGARTPAPTAAAIASDQAGVDTAQVALDKAAGDLAEASLLAPITGTVVAVAMAAGQHVRAAAANASAAPPHVTVVGSGAQQVSAALSDTQIGAVHVGMAARVLPDGAATALPAVVTAVAALGSTSAAGVVSYPITVALPPGQHRPLGSGAQLTLLVARAKAAVTVPTSAVRTRGKVHFVDVWRAGRVRPIRVVLGAVGPTLTQLRSGVPAGTRVVLARLDAPLPSSTLSPQLLRRGAGRRGGRVK